jgi:hypothetical protein
MTKQRSSPNAAAGDDNRTAGRRIDEFCVNEQREGGDVPAGSTGLA